MDQISAAMPPLAGLPEGSAKAQGRAGAAHKTDRLREEAERFEATFLAEMLRYAGLGKMPETFNGGAGEAAFAGSLVQEYANRIAATGHLGIAEQVYETLVRREAG